MKAEDSEKHNYWLHMLFMLAEVTVIVLFAFCTKYESGLMKIGTNEADYEAQNKIIKD